MKLYWGFNTIPELQGLAKSQQQRLWRIGVRAGWRMPRVWSGYLLMALLLSMGNFGPLLLPGFPDGLPELLWKVSWTVVGFLLGQQIAIRAIRPVMAMHRQAMEAKPSKDGSYYVPPAI